MLLWQGLNETITLKICLCNEVLCLEKTIAIMAYAMMIIKTSAWNIRGKAPNQKLIVEYPLGTKEPMKDQNDEVVVDDIMMMTM